MLTTDQKGSIAELAIAKTAADLRFDVYWPLTQGGRYDMVIDIHRQLFRVQCKWAVKDGNVVVIRAYSNRRTRTGMFTRKYLSSEIAALAAYCAELDTCYFVPVTLASNRRQIHLRLSPCKNNQRLAINWAKMYEFRSIDWEQLSSLGAIAQLGERLSGTQEVAGSSPASSTDLKLTLRFGFVVLGTSAPTGVSPTSPASQPSRRSEPESGRSPRTRQRHRPGSRSD